MKDSGGIITSNDDFIMQFKEIIINTFMISI